LRGGKKEKTASSKTAVKKEARERVGFGGCRHKKTRKKVFAVRRREEYHEHREKPGAAGLKGGLGGGSTEYPGTP